MSGRSARATLLAGLLSWTLIGPLSADRVIAAPRARSAAESETHKKKRFQIHLGANAGHAVIAGDHFATVSATAAIEAGDMAFDLVAPLRYRIQDVSPRDGEAAMGIRSLDWDEPSEWLRVLRRLEFRRSGDAIYGRVGRLAGATIGHGSLVLGYHNNLQPDHGMAGLRLDTDLGLWGLQAFINDVVTWQVLALRAFLRPLDSSPSRLLRSLTLAATFAADLQAPLHPITDVDGARAFDSRGVLRAERDLLAMYGLDLGLEAWRSKSTALVPYLDLNLMPRSAEDLGVGLHGGLYLHVRPRDPTFELILRYEARLESGPYAAAWFDGMYEVERFQYQRGGEAMMRTKLGWDHVAERGPTRVGHMIDGEMRIHERFVVIARCQRLPGEGGVVGRDLASLAVHLPPTREVELNGFVGLRPSAEDDWTVVAAAALRWRFWRPLYAFVDYHRAWHVVDEGTLRYGVTNDWTWGLGARSTF